MKKAFSLVYFVVMIAVGSWAVVTALQYYGVASCKVVGESMAPTYHDGYILMMSAYELHKHGPQKGDVVVFRDVDGVIVIKRIALVPGEVDTVSPRAGWRILGRNQYIVLGDNANNSMDSREYGPVHRDQMIGVVK